MIFSIWFVVWVAFLASTAWHLMVPALCLAARSSYLSRHIFPGRSAVLVAAVVYVLVWVTLPEQALMYCLRTFLFLALTAHLLSAARTRGLRLKGIQYDAANTLHLVGRSLRVARARMAELRYTKMLRIRRESSFIRRSLSRLKANPEHWRATVLEFLQLSTSFEDMIRARGRFPHPSEWQDPKRIQAWLYWADGILLFIALVGFLSIDTILLPDQIVEIARALRSFITASVSL